MSISPIEDEYNEIEGRNEWLKAYQVGAPRLFVCTIATFIFCLCMCALVVMLTMVNVQNVCVKKCIKNFVEIAIGIADSVIILDRRIDFVLTYKN